jgi:hypothetical protein
MRPFCTQAFKPHALQQRGWLPAEAHAIAAAETTAGAAVMAVAALAAGVQSFAAVVGA